MFRPPWTWHERVRRRFCQAVFVLLCVLPTSLVLGWAIREHLPGTHVAMEERLGLRLGVRVTAAHVSRPRPGMVRWHTVTLADPETGQPLLESPLIEAVAMGQSWMLCASTASVDARRADRLWLLVAGLLRQTDAPTVRLTIRDVRLVDDGDEHALGDFEAQLRPLAEGTQARLSFRTGDGSSRATLNAVRNRQTTPPSTRFELRTGKAALPCALISALWPPAKCLGPEGKFRGFVWATRRDEKWGDDLWDGELAGELTALDVGRLLATGLPGEIRGSGRLSIERARISGGRLSEATGMLSMGPGTVGRELLARVATQLRLVSALSDDGLSDDGLSDDGLSEDGASEDGPRSRAFDQLALGFTVRSEGLTLHGACTNAPANTVVMSRGRPVLFTQRQHHLTVETLLRAFGVSGSSTATRLGPMSPKVQRLARILPLPVARR